MKSLSMRQLLAAGVHFGHQISYWDPKMKPFIFGKRGSHKPIHIINLDKSLPMLNDALEYMGHVVAHRGKVMFVGTKFAARDAIREEATRCGMPYVDYRWLGGMLTNYKTIRQSIKRLKDLERMTEDGFLAALTKKEALSLSRERDKLAMSLSGIKEMGSLPDCLFVVDVGAESIAIKEANCLGIPVVGIVDTNNSPDGIDYVIPGNDDALRAIRLYCKTLADLIIEIRGTPEQIAEEAKRKEEQRQAERASKVTHKKSTRSKTVVAGQKAVDVSAKPVKKAAEKANPKRKTVTKKLAPKADEAKTAKKPAAKKAVPKKVVAKMDSAKKEAQSAKFADKETAVKAESADVAEPGKDA